MKKILRVALIILAILILGFLALLLIAYLNRTPSLYMAYDNADRYTVGSFTYDPQTVDAVDVTWLSGTVEFRKGSGARLNVSEPEDGLSDKQRMRWWLDGRTLRVQCWASKYGTDKDVNKPLTLEIPDGVALSVSLKNGSLLLGSHTLRELNAVITGAGTIQADVLNAEGPILLSDGAGDVRINGISAASMQMKTILGEAQIGRIDVQDELQMHSSRGTLNVGSVTARQMEIDDFMDVAIVLERCDTANIHGTRTDAVLTIPSGMGATVDFVNEFGKLNGRSVDKAERLTIGDGSCQIRADVEALKIGN